MKRNHLLIAVGAIVVLVAGVVALALTGRDDDRIEFEEYLDSFAAEQETPPPAIQPAEPSPATDDPIPALASAPFMFDEWYLLSAEQESATDVASPDGYEWVVLRFDVERTGAGSGWLWEGTFQYVGSDGQVYQSDWDMNYHYDNSIGNFPEVYQGAISRDWVTFVAVPSGAVEGGAWRVDGILFEAEVK